MIKAVVFDMDGVIFDTIPFARSEFLRIHPGLTETQYNEIHAGNFHIEAGKYTHLKLKESEREEAERKSKYTEAKSKSKVFEGIKELLGYLHKSGVILALNTNAFQRHCQPLLENNGLESLFDFVADAEVTIDKIEKFYLIRKKFGLMTEEVIFVTDALGDVRDADVAGIPTVGVTWGVHDSSYFQREKHDNLVAIVRSPTELGEFIISRINQNPI